MIDLTALHCFVAVADDLSFRRAAERLHMSQPPLTRLIAQLEHRLGVRLFERTTRRVALTPAGLALLRLARPLLDQAQAVAREVRHHVADRSRALRVVCTSLAFATVLPELLRRFRRAHPKTAVEVTELPTEAQIAALVAAEADVGFVLLPAAHPALEVRPLLRERMRLAVAATHPLAGQGPLPLAMFAHDTFLLHAREENPAMHDEIVRACAQAGVRPKFQQKTRDQNCMGLVSAGIGVHFVAGHAACIGGRSIAYVEIEEPAPVLELAIAWRRDDSAPELALFQSTPSRITGRKPARKAASPRRRSR